MDRDRIIGLVIILGMMIVYFQFFAPRHSAKRSDHTPTSATTGVVHAQSPTSPLTVTKPATLIQPPASPASQTLESLPTFVVSNRFASFSFTPYDACLTKIELAKSPIVRKGPIVTATAATNDWEMPLRLRSFGDLPLTGVFCALEIHTANSLSFTGMLSDAILFRAYYVLSNEYFLHATLSFSNVSDTTIPTTNLCSVWLGRINHVSASPDRYDLRSADASILLPNGKHDLRRFKPEKKDVIQEILHPIVWIAVRNKYFAHILVPDTPCDAAFVASCGHPNDRLVSPFVAFSIPPLPPAHTASWHATLYAGPKAYELLKALPARLGRGKDYLDLLNLGWFSFLAKPILLYGLKGIYQYTHSYGIAIIILTIVVKLLTWPLQTKSYDSMQRMQKLQPELKKLQEQFKNDPRRLQHEQMLLYRKHGVNPLGGCLPILLQIPIFIALYQALSNAIELWGASFWWIKDLSLPDTVAHLPFALPFLGSAINPLPLLMTAATIAQQMLTPHTGDKTQKQMAYLMPVIFLFFFYNMPSGLVLYWFVSQILSAAQMLYLHYVRTP